MHGIYRTPAHPGGLPGIALPEHPTEARSACPGLDDQILHAKYKIPAHCFAYVGDPTNPASWKLPYRLADGSHDVKRLPKAIQAILSNYRGARVSSVPEPDIPDVLVRLARAAVELGRMPHQCGDPAPVYVQLNLALVQLDRLDEIQ